MIAAVLLTLQAATPAVRLPPPGPPERIVLLNCPKSTGDEVVVCGESTDALPPEERGSKDRPRASNPDMTGIGALAAAAPVCGARQGGCASGVNLLGMGTAAVRLVGKLIDPDSCCDQPGEATSVGKLVGDVAKAFRKKPDKSQRVAIDLDAPPPSTAGRLTP
ncbi:hypothetical protein GCM10011380_27880 [Sphingomonas metalli]|uniref:Uncharacterized protein n=1 Tax=Sphingomonas metalli TaxID=1779358 RepID=A0A916WVC1_9SPHN|nr:hypothetical protein [Sphingomonas metalli]GGB36913.1 hypothetical protein GCM10011380_27880 [Sphingomonas metalli]